MANWVRAKVRPQVSVAGRVARTPRHLSMMKTRAMGTKTASRGVWRPTICERVCSGWPLTVARVVIGTEGTEGHWCGVGDQCDYCGFYRFEAQGDEHDAGDCHRGAEAGQGLQECAEAEGDDDCLDPLVVTDLGE